MKEQSVVNNVYFSNCRKDILLLKDFAIDRLSSIDNF
jgi:hypothetical protein